MGSPPEINGGHRWLGPPWSEDDCEICHKTFPPAQMWMCWKTFWYSDHRHFCDACVATLRQTNPFPLYADSIPSHILDLGK